VAVIMGRTVKEPVGCRGVQVQGEGRKEKKGVQAWKGKRERRWVNGSLKERDPRWEENRRGQQQGGGRNGD
jgi:hypothetical protein